MAEDHRYKTLLSALAQKLVAWDLPQCVFFLGSGMGSPHLPTGSQLAALLAKDCDLDFPKPVPLPTVAFFYEFYKTRSLLNQFLRKKLGDQAIPVSVATSRLVDLIVRLEELQDRREGKRQQKEPVLVITTNYDRHFELMYRQKTGRDVDVVVYNGGRDANEEGVSLHVVPGRGVEDLHYWQVKTTSLYKMHGCISDPGDEEKRNLVITEEDYINFLSNCLSTDPKKRVPFSVMARLAESPVIFIGYSLSDWNFRVVFKTTTEKRHRDCYAVQKKPVDDALSWDPLVEFWREKKVQIIDQSAEQFLKDLREAVEELVPAVAG